MFIGVLTKAWELLGLGVMLRLAAWSVRKLSMGYALTPRLRASIEYVGTWFRILAFAGLGLTFFGYV